MQNNQQLQQSKQSNKLSLQQNHKRPLTIGTSNNQVQFQILQQPQQQIESIFQYYSFYGKQIGKQEFEINCPSTLIRLNCITEFQTLKIYDNIVLYEKQPCNGKLYQVKYDANNNPKFLTVEGEFSWQNDSHEIQIVKQLVKYIAKSNIRSKEIENGGVTQNVKPPIEESYFPQTWIKCNQQICENDIRILQPNSRQWVTSSIIDSYALLLNIQSSKKYFLKPSSERSKIDRLLIVNSTVFAQFFQVEQKFEVTDQHLEVFKREFLEYQEMEFQLWNIFKKIAFVMNENYHWFLILIDFSIKKTIISIYDSFGNDKKWYQGYCMYFKKFFTKLGFACGEFASEIGQQNIYQNDGYSCGYHTCSNMRFLSQKQFDKDVKNKYDEKEMKCILNDLLKRQ